MRHFKLTFLPVLLIGLWINIAETIKWELLIKKFWIDHYQELNIDFPEEVANIILWMVWGFFYASVIFILSKKFNVLQTTLLSWIAVFAMMWMVVWNIGVLPTTLLLYNIPLSLLVTLVGAWMAKKFIART